MKPEDVTEYFKIYKDELCGDTIEYFLQYFMHFLQDAVMTFLPFGGIYLTNRILQETAFYWETKGNNYFSEEFKKKESYSSMMEQFRVSLVTIPDTAERGCFKYAQLEKLV